MVKDVIDFLIQQDPQVGNAVQAEYDRQRRNIELIASENFVSQAVLAAASSVLTNKYAEGYPGKRYYGGCECVDVVEDIARDRAKALFGADHANVQPHSGASANYAVYQALCNVGDTVMGMNLDNGGPLMHIITAKAVAFGEAMKPEFKTYQEQVLKNAKVLAESLMDAGFQLVSGGTDNHLMLVDLRPANITGKEMEKRLDQVNITVNKNTIPDDPQSPFVTSGIRVGVPAATSRGLREEDMKVIGQLIWKTKQEEIRAAVAEITAKYPLYE